MVQLRSAIPRVDFRDLDVIDVSQECPPGHKRDILRRNSRVRLPALPQTNISQRGWNVRCGVSLYCDSDAARTFRLGQLFEVLFSLLGVSHRKFGNRFIECSALATVPGNCRWIT